MRTAALLMLLLVCMALTITGCANLSETKISAPYVMETGRVDQGLDGNRGYLEGTPPPAKDRSALKRPMIAVDVDLPPTSREAGIPDTKLVNTSKMQEEVK